MRRSRLAAARAGHVRKRGQPCGRQRNVGSPRGPHLMVSTSMVYGCIIDVFNTEDISAECAGSKHAAGPAMSGLRRITAGGILARFARLKRASCCGMHSEGNPSGPFVLGLRGLKLRRRIVRFAPRVLSIGIEMHLVLFALRLFRPRSFLGSRPFCCGSNMNVVLMSR